MLYEFVIFAKQIAKWVIFLGIAVELEMFL